MVWLLSPDQHVSIDTMRMTPSLTHVALHDLTALLECPLISQSTECLCPWQCSAPFILLRSLGSCAEPWPSGTDLLSASQTLHDYFIGHRNGGATMGVTHIPKRVWQAAWDCSGSHLSLSEGQYRPEFPCRDISGQRLDCSSYFYVFIVYIPIWFSNIFMWLRYEKDYGSFWHPFWDSKWQVSMST